MALLVTCDGRFGIGDAVKDTAPNGVFDLSGLTQGDREPAKGSASTNTHRLQMAEITSQLCCPEAR
jgi:hypothetical protein